MYLTSNMTYYCQIRDGMIRTKGGSLTIRVTTDGSENYLYVLDSPRIELEAWIVISYKNKWSSGVIQSFAGDGGSALQAKLNGPEGVFVDSAGNIYIADTYTRSKDGLGKQSLFCGFLQSCYSSDKVLKGKFYDLVYEH